MGVTKTERLAFEILHAVSEEGAKSHLKTAETFARHPELTAKDRAVITGSVRGTLEKQLVLDRRIEELASLPVRKMKPKVRCALRLGFYQLLYLDRIKPYRAIHDSVELVRMSGYEGLTGFVNGVLRAASVKEDWKTLPEAAQAGFPEWLWEKLVREYGRETVRETAAARSGRNPLTLRVNLSRAGTEEVVGLLEKDGWTVLPAPVPGALFLERSDEALPLEKTKAISRGLAVPQDLSGILALRLAAPPRGASVLDLCAAPGSKTLHAADLVGEDGSVLACDLTQKKLRLLEENIRRNGFRNIRTQQADALILDPQKEEAFDLVIADLPCSGLGVIGRKPEILLRITEEEIRSLAGMQQSILQNAVRYVKPGGRLLFSTCTVTKEENRDNAARIRESGLVPLPLTGEVPEAFSARLGENGLQLLPSAVSDGFFISIWERPDE